MSSNVSNESLAKVVETSVAVLKTVGDPTVVNEAAKIEAAVKQMTELNAPIVQQYADNLKAFDQGLVSKYGTKVARVIEFACVLAVAAKMYFLG